MPKNAQLDRTERVVHAMFAPIRNASTPPERGFVRAVEARLNALEHPRGDVAPPASIVCVGLLVQWLNIVTGMVLPKTRDTGVRK